MTKNYVWFFIELAVYVAVALASIVVCDFL